MRWPISVILVFKSELMHAEHFGLSHCYSKLQLFFIYTSGSSSSRSTIIYIYISKCKYVSTRFSVLQVKYQVQRKYTSISWLVSAAPQQHILLIPTSRLWLRVLAVCRRKRHDQPQPSPLSSIAAMGFALFCFQHKGKEVTLDASGLLH